MKPWSLNADQNFKIKSVVALVRKLKLWAYKKFLTCEFVNL